MSSNDLGALLRTFGNIWDNCVDLLDSFSIGGVSLWFILVMILVLGLLLGLLHNLSIK